MIETHCDYCGKTYEAARSTSRYCSSRCRQRAHRNARSQVGIEAGRIKDAVQNLVAIGHDQMRNNAHEIERVIDALEKLKSFYLKD